MSNTQNDKRSDMLEKLRRIQAEKVRQVIEGKVQKITGVPDGAAPVPVTAIRKRATPRPRKPLVSDNEVERAKIELVEFARKNKPTLLDIIFKKLDEPCPDDNSKTRAEDLAEHFLTQMKKSGSYQHFKELIDRQNGKVPEKIENQISIVQPNLPLVINDFDRIASATEDHEEDPQARNN